MISLSSWFFFLCDCFASDFMIDIVTFKIFQRIYQIHQNHFFCCKWYLQIERVRDTHAKQIRFVDWNQTIQQCIQIVLQSMKQIFSSKQTKQTQLIKKQEQNDENFRAKQARLIQQQIEKKRQKTEKVRIAKKQEEIRLTIFACKRCFVKYSNNIKFHEHIRDHHAKKSKSVVSNSIISFFILFHSTIFLFDTSNQVFTFTTFSQSIVALSFTSSFSFSQSIIVFDISKRNLMQMRIIFYFLSFSKSTKFEIFTLMYDSIKQSIRVSFSRFSYHSFRFFFSIRFLFSTNFYFSSVCWRCQEFFVICLFRNWIDFVATRVEISMRRRERRLFL